MDSILETVRVACSLDRDNDEFDDELVPLVNSALATLNHLGVGSPDGMAIESSKTHWTDFIVEGPLLNLVKQLVGTKVKLAFDPPTSTAVLGAYQDTVKELTWRIIEMNEGR